MEFIHSLPASKVIFGSGKLEKVGLEASKVGSNILLVTGKSSMQQLGFLDEVTGYLEQENLKYIHFNEVTPNPTTKTVDAGANLALEKDCDVIIGFGGGSAIDAAKSIAVVAGHRPKGGSKHIWDYVPVGENSENITNATLPILTIPTTSGTGSHVTPYAVITNPANNGKPGFGEHPMFPEVSIVDPNILKHMPRRLTAITGFDVYAHVSENLVAKGDHPTADPYAKQAIRYVNEYLPQAYNKGNDLEPREIMAIADTYAGISNTLSSTGLPHAMEHAISGHNPSVPHAQGLASITIPVMNYNIENGDEIVRRRYAIIAKQFGAIDKITDEKEDAPKSIESVNNLITNLNLDQKLSGLGVEKASIKPMVEATFEYMGADVDNNPVQPSKQDVEKLFEESM